MGRRGIAILAEPWASDGRTHCETKELRNSLTFVPVPVPEDAMALTVAVQWDRMSMIAVEAFRVPAEACDDKGRVARWRRNAATPPPVAGHSREVKEPT